MAIVVVTSNILVQFLILDGLLTWGAFTYPLAFLVTDVVNRTYGPKSARKIVLAGFIVGVICSLVGSQIMLEFGPAVPLRVAVASGTAFAVAQLFDIALFDRLRQGVWWRAPLVSSFASSALDTALFFFLAFSASVSLGVAADADIAWAQDSVPLLTSGPDAPLWVTLAIADYMVKLAVAVIALIPFRVVVGLLSPRP